MNNPPFLSGNWFKELLRELECEFWLTMATGASTPALRRAYTQRYFYASTQP